jgi:hypothetical protein
LWVRAAMSGVDTSVRAFDLARVDRRCARGNVVRKP